MKNLFFVFCCIAVIVPVFSLRLCASEVALQKLFAQARAKSPFSLILPSEERFQERNIRRGKQPDHEDWFFKDISDGMRRSYREETLCNFRAIKVVEAQTVTVCHEGLPWACWYQREAFYAGDVLAPQNEDGLLKDLHAAVLAQDKAAVKEFLSDSTTDVNGLNYCGNTPAHYAVACDNMKILFALLRYGADLNIASRYRGESAMHLLYTAQQQAVREWQNGRVKKLEREKREKKEHIKQLLVQLAQLQKEMGQLKEDRMS